MVGDWHGRTVGILGGMGPAATVDFYAKLIRCTPAARDQDHLRVVVWADPGVPDRSAALVGDGEDPTPYLEHGTRVLLEAGAEVIAVACNTAHAFLPLVVERTGARVVHMVERTADHVASLRPRVSTAGILATTGTLRAGLYQRALAESGIAVVLPDDADQARVMRSIASVKAGVGGAPERAAVLRVAETLAASGAEVVVAGCTELALLLDGADVGVPWVDPALVLARAVVAAARP